LLQTNVVDVAMLYTSMHISMVAAFNFQNVSDFIKKIVQFQHVFRILECNILYIMSTFESQTTLINFRSYIQANTDKKYFVKQHMAAGNFTEEFYEAFGAAVPGGKENL
jgi:uncharacterized protein YlbG (UPF0298 family)